MAAKKIAAVFLVLVLGLLNSGLLFAAEPFDLETLIKEALKNNPQLKAAQSRYAAALARVKLLRNLEDPRLEYEYDKIKADMDAVMRGKTAPMRTIGISQEIPFPAKLIIRRNAAEQEAKSLKEDYQEKENEIVQKVKEAYSQLFLSYKKIEINQENLALLGQFVKITTRRYSTGKTSQQDVLKAQVEYSKLSNELVLFDQEEKIAQAMLNALLGRSSDLVIVIPEEQKYSELELNEEKILKLTLENRPELTSVKKMLRKSEMDYSLSKLEYAPDFMLKYQREERDNSLGEWSAMIGVTVPLWFWEKQNSSVKEARANLEEMRAQYKAQENMVLFETRTALAKFQAARNLVKTYETGVLPQAQAALETARLNYQADKIGFLDLLDSQRSLREFQIDYFESLANLEISLAELERAVGVYLVIYDKEAKIWEKREL